MSVGCRLKLLHLPTPLTDKYLIKSIHNSELINQRIYRDNEDPGTFIQHEKYNLNKIFTDKGQILKDTVILEICCGTGDFITTYAKNHPEKSFIGVDYALPVIERSIIKASTLKLDNIIFYNGKIEDFLGWDFKGTLFDEIFLNFPDPWPKKRHLKRRIINDAIMPMLASALKQEGYFISATDLEYLYNYQVEILNNSPLLQNLLTEKQKYTPPVTMYDTMSSYEMKGRAKERKIHYTKHSLALQDV